MNPEDTVLPVIHLNGTSPVDLELNWGLAVDAIETAIQRLQRASPNARDYYLAPGGAYNQAAAQYRDAIDSLRAIREWAAVHHAHAAGAIEELEARRRRIEP